MPAELSSPPTPEHRMPAPAEAAPVALENALVSSEAPSAQTDGGAPPEQHPPGVQVNERLVPEADIYGPLHALGVEITSLRPLDVHETAQVEAFLNTPNDQTSPEGYDPQLAALGKLEVSLRALSEPELAEKTANLIKDSEARRFNLDQARSSGRLGETTAYAVAEKAQPLLDPMLEARSRAEAQQARVAAARTRVGQVIAGLATDNLRKDAATTENQFNNALKAGELETPRG